MATYTRKHYIEIGNTLRNAGASKKEIDGWIERFKKDNPRFDESTFRSHVSGKKVQTGRKR